APPGPEEPLHVAAPGSPAPIAGNASADASLEQEFCFFHSGLHWLWGNSPYPVCRASTSARSPSARVLPYRISGAKCCRYAVGEPMTKRLTAAAVERARAPKTGQVFLWDGAVRGFGVRILSSGSKTFWFQYRPRGGGSSRMIRIGRFPDISIADARNEAHKYAAERAHGGNPAADLQAERRRDKITLRALLAEGGDYPRELENRRLVNIKPVLSSLRRGLHGLMGKEVSTLTRRDLVDAIDVVKDGRGPGAAQDLRKFARVFLEWGVDGGPITRNPLAGWPRAGQRPRRTAPRRQP